MLNVVTVIVLINTINMYYTITLHHTDEKTFCEPCAIELVVELKILVILLRSSRQNSIVVWFRILAILCPAAKYTFCLKNTLFYDFHTLWFSLGLAVLIMSPW